MGTDDQIHYLRSFLQKVKIKDIMDTSVKKVNQDEDLSKVIEIFATNRIYCVPVVDKDNKLMGLITHKYVYKAQSLRKMMSDEVLSNPWIVMDINAYYEKTTINRFILKNVMYKNPPFLGPDVSLSEAVP